MVVLNLFRSILIFSYYQLDFLRKVQIIAEVNANFILAKLKELFTSNIKFYIAFIRSQVQVNIVDANCFNVIVFRVQENIQD